MPNPLYTIKIILYIIEFEIISLDLSVNRSSAKFTGPRRDVYLALCLDLIVKLYRIFVSFSWSSYLTYVLCSILDWTILGFSAAYFCHINLIDVPDDCFMTSYGSLRKFLSFTENSFIQPLVFFKQSKRNMSNIWSR